MKKRTDILARMVAIGAAVCATLAPATLRADVLLQWFEGSWETIERRMPDVFAAGYMGIWVPPPGLADSGGFSVGYDVFDRFNLGSPFQRTLFGTTNGFRALSTEMDRAGMSLYIDAVLNHNGFRDGSTTGFEANGGYPGFVTRLPGDVDGDFHGSFEGGDLNGRLAGLIDIAQNKNNIFTRHPVPGGENPIPNETPRESNRALYPDRDLPAEFGRFPYNIANPQAGDPTQENATGLLTRYMQWMVEVHGVDGFRLDATKHIPTWFFADFYDAALFNSGKNPIDGSRYTPFSFGEAFTGDFGVLSAYTRKDGFGNRDSLDFPLYFAMQGVLDAGGFGDMRNLELASFDGADGTPNDGSLGVMFSASHDKFGAGAFSGLGNIAEAHVLTRTGFPLVYYNSQEFGTNRDFPKGGRGDALGNFGSDLITRLVRVNREYIRNGHQTRWIDGDIYIYERTSQAIVAISDRKDNGFDERNVQTGFPAGTVLTELTGNATRADVDPDGVSIPDTVTVDGNGRVSIRVPRNASTAAYHGRGFVVYGPAAPASTLNIVNAESTIGPDPADGRAEGTRRLTPLRIVTAETIAVSLTVAASAASPNDNALIKVNFGELDIDGDGNRNAAGLFAGFEQFPETGRPAGSTTASRVYTASIDATGLKEGYTYIQTAAFLQRAGGNQPIFSNAREVVYLDRLPPQQAMLFPGQSGNADISSKDYEAVFSVDHTVNALHVLRNISVALTDEQVLALVSDANRARRHDRLEWRSVLTDLQPGTLELTVVAFEESGNYSIVRYGNIDVNVPRPEVLIGVDIDNTPGGANFQGLPGTINAPALQNEIVIRVRTQNIDGLGRNISFPADFTLDLRVDDGAPIVAVPFNAGLLPPVERLVQNDQAFGDEYDEFRFVWRGYSTGSHVFTATAALIDGSEEPNSAIASTTVAANTPGPSITITRPASGNDTVNNPSELTVQGLFNDGLTAYARIFIDVDGDAIPLATIENAAAGPFGATRRTASYATVDVLPPGALSLFNGTFPVRVIASTGRGGTGITSEANASWTVTGIPNLPTLPPLTIDGNAEDILNAGSILAVSPADGPTGDTNPADFGADGTLTELRAALRGSTLYVALRGEFFGADNSNTDNVSILYVDTNSGSAQGVTNMGTQLNDESDGLRGDISRAAFSLSTELITAGNGIDLAVGMTAPGTTYGYSFGSDLLPGAPDAFAFQPGIAVAYDASTGPIPAALGTTIAGGNTFEIALPLRQLGSPALSGIRLAAATAGDSGYASPNTLPENANNAFGTEPNAQVFEGLALLPTLPKVLINEVYTGATDLVELHNPNAQQVDIGGWALRISDSAGVTADYVFPAATMIAAGGYLVLSDEGGANPPQSPQISANIRIGMNIPWDETRGGAVALVDGFGAAHDLVAWRSILDSAADDSVVDVYGTEFTGTIAGSASLSVGHSLARNSVSTDTDDSADWNAESGVDANGPTFGGANTAGSLIRGQLWMLH